MKRRIITLSVFLAGALAPGAVLAQDIRPPADQAPIVALGCQQTYFVATSRGWVFSFPFEGSKLNGTRVTVPEYWGTMGRNVTVALRAAVNRLYAARIPITKLHFTPDCRGWAIMADGTVFSRNADFPSSPSDPGFPAAVRIARGSAVSAAALDPFRYKTMRGFGMVFSRPVSATSFPVQPVHVRAFARLLPRYDLFRRAGSAFPLTGRTVVDIAFMPHRDKPSGFTILASDGNSYTNAISRGTRTTGSAGTLAAYEFQDLRRSCERDPTETKCLARNVNYDTRSSVTYSYSTTLRAVQRAPGVRPVAVAFAPGDYAPAYEYALFASDGTLFASPLTLTTMSSTGRSRDEFGTAATVGPLVPALVPSL